MFVTKFLTVDFEVTLYNSVHKVCHLAQLVLPTVHNSPIYTSILHVCTPFCNPYEAAELRTSKHPLLCTHLLTMVLPLKTQCKTRNQFDF